MKPYLTVFCNARQECSRFGRNILNVKSKPNLTLTLTVALTLTLKSNFWKVLKKETKTWSHELKHATTTTKTKVAKMRAKLKMIGTADQNASAMLPGGCCLSE